MVMYGLIASNGLVRKIAFTEQIGNEPSSAVKGLGFSSIDELEAWCDKNEVIIGKSYYAYADICDFAFGIQKLDPSKSSQALIHFNETNKRLAEAACALKPNNADLEASLQHIVSLVERAMKGALLFWNAGYESRTWSDLHTLALDMTTEQRRNAIQEHRDDRLLLEMVKKFPPLEDCRRYSIDKSRLEIIELAMIAQFIAASAVRRISGINQAVSVEKEYGPRSRYFS